MESTGELEGMRSKERPIINVPTFPGIDSCLKVTKRDFLKMEESL